MATKEKNGMGQYEVVQPTWGTYSKGDKIHMFKSTAAGPLAKKRVKFLKDVTVEEVRAEKEKKRVDRAKANAKKRSK